MSEGIFIGSPEHIAISNLADILAERHDISEAATMSILLRLDEKIGQWKTYKSKEMNLSNYVFGAQEAGDGGE